MISTTLGLVGGVLELAVSARWFRLLRQVRIPTDRRRFYAAHATALLLGLAAFAIGGATPLGAGFALVAILSAATFLGLAAQAQQARVRPAVGVGERIIDFVLPDETGHPFDLASLRGRPFLLKFFRGHW